MLYPGILKNQAPDSYFIGGCSEGGGRSVTYEEQLTMKNAKEFADRDVLGGCSEDFPQCTKNRKENAGSL